VHAGTNCWEGLGEDGEGWEREGETWQEFSVHART